MGNYLDNCPPLLLIEIIAHHIIKNYLLLANQNTIKSTECFINAWTALWVAPPDWQLSHSSSRRHAASVILAVRFRHFWNTLYYKDRSAVRQTVKAVEGAKVRISKIELFDICTLIPTKSTMLIMKEILWYLVRQKCYLV